MDISVDHITAPNANVPAKNLAAKLRIGPGRPLPIGVHECFDGLNFAVFSRHAEHIELLLFEEAASTRPYATIPLHAESHRTGDIWHVAVLGATWGQAYAYRVHGPWAPNDGHRFDSSVLLMDPYATAIGATEAWGLSAQAVRPAAAKADADRHWLTPKAILVDRRFDWNGVRRPHRSWSDTIIYEAHLRGLTIGRSSEVTHPGTYLGLIEKIPYLLELGVTAVELLPVQEFNETSVGRMDPTTGAMLRNYWGYDTAAFFAPKESYATRPGAQIDEFKTMVRELHRAGIEVILDGVLTHTAEGDETGPTLSFRGLDNAIYYSLEDDRSRYRDYSGCRNTLNCNHPVVRALIIDCLRYWATEMQVDGFRFDLATILGRDAHGRLLPNPPLLEQIAEDPILRDMKLIAEAWDAGGAYQVGSFHGQRWAEWNGRFRDDVRRFWRGDRGMAGALAWRLCGSADMYQRVGKAPVNSINFVTCHDGFTLNDVVSYARKHNGPNGEGNRDGIGDDFSANYGIEGETSDPEVETLRLRQIKNMLATVMLSRGVPMLLAGDEFRRTQNGNNNAYCQDNETSWLDWALAEKNRDLVRFVRRLIDFRRRNSVLRRDAFYTEREVKWFAPDGNTPDWDGGDGRVGCVIWPAGNDWTEQGSPLCLLFNPQDDAADFPLPPMAGDLVWRLAVDTAERAPRDAVEPGSERPLPPGRFALWPHSLAVLVAG